MSTGGVVGCSCCEAAVGCFRLFEAGMGTSVSVSESDEMRRAGATRFLDGLVCGADSVGVVALCLDGCCDRLGRMVSEIENETATVCRLMQCNEGRMQ